jgi:hypothetical protein
MKDKPCRHCRRAKESDKPDVLTHCEYFQVDFAREEGMPPECPRFKCRHQWLLQGSGGASNPLTDTQFVSRDDLGGEQLAVCTYCGQTRNREEVEALRRARYEFTETTRIKIPPATDEVSAPTAPERPEGVDFVMDGPAMHVFGPLDAANLSAFSLAVRDLPKAEGKQLVINLVLSPGTMAISLYMGEIIQLHSAVEGGGRELHLFCTARQRRQFAMVGLDRLLRMHVVKDQDSAEGIETMDPFAEEE